MRYELHVNGLDNAYTREFGCGCERCTRATRAANTSLSLIGLNDAGTVQHHVLFDAGSGILESLIENPLLRAHPRLDAVVLTHWHSDHTSELTRVTTTLARSRRRQGLPATPTPVWCRTGSAAWLERQYPHLHGSSVELRRFGDAEPMGTILEPLALEIPGVTITPVSTAHSTADLHPDDPTTPSLLRRVHPRVRRYKGRSTVGFGRHEPLARGRESSRGTAFARRGSRVF